MTITEHPEDSRGVRLCDGQWVTITISSQLIEHLNIFSERLKFVGNKFICLRFEKAGYNGILVWCAVVADQDSTRYGGYSRWPTAGLTAELGGLKGLVNRYKEEVGHGRQTAG